MTIMMQIKDLIERYEQSFLKRYENVLLPSHRKALDAILACHSQCGECLVHCPSCEQRRTLALSCGHRSCPQCQHHLGDRWHERQASKLLPVQYFMITFTIPESLRTTAWRHQAIFYDILFKAAAETLRTIGKNNHGMRVGMTGVLHTHTRLKTYHPHIHMVMPGGGLIEDQGKTAWKSLSQNYLINEFAIAKVFRGILFRMLYEQHVPLPRRVEDKFVGDQWVAHVKRIGRGDKALKYLSRYLYRGVISENDVLHDDDGQVTFRYRDSTTRRMMEHRLPATSFLWRLMLHVLPRGFRRARDFGFLHGNAKLILQRIQLALHVRLPKPTAKKRVIACRQCQHPLTVIAVDAWKIPFRFRVLVKAIANVNSG
jgi:ferredoxin